MRLLQLFAAGAISGRGYIAARPCAQIASDGVVPASVIEAHWPGCADYFSGASPGEVVVVDANYHGLPIEINVALSVVSGLCAFLAMLLHTAGVELYVSPLPPLHLSFSSVVLCLFPVCAPWAGREGYRRLAASRHVG